MQYGCFISFRVFGLLPKLPSYKEVALELLAVKICLARQIDSTSEDLVVLVSREDYQVSNLVIKDLRSLPGHIDDWWFSPHNYKTI